MYKKNSFFIIANLLLSLMSFANPIGANESAQVKTVVLNGRRIDLNQIPQTNSTQKIIVQTKLVHQARDMVRDGMLDEALEKYNESLNPLLINSESEKSMALWGILQIHQWQGKFELALEELQWFLKARPDKDYYIDKKLELEALIKARATGTNQPIYEFIEAMKKKYDKYLPPKGWNPPSDSVISTIIQLYDYIGDAEGGIAFIERLLTFQPLQKPSKVRNEYLAMIEAFKTDKQTGKTGGPKRIILQSDNMPW